MPYKGGRLPASVYHVDPVTAPLRHELRRTCAWAARWHGSCGRVPRVPLLLRPRVRSGVRSKRAFMVGRQGGMEMLWTITILLFVLWLIGMVSNYTMGGLIHLLLLIAVVTMLIRIIQGRRPI